MRNRGAAAWRIRAVSIPGIAIAAGIVAFCAGSAPPQASEDYPHATTAIERPRAAALESDSDSNSLGRRVEDFTLRDEWNRPRSLSDFADAELVVLAFLGTDCPLARLYAPRLAALADVYAPRGVALLGIDSNRQDSRAEIAAFCRQHALNFPMLKDVGNSLADKLGAQRTPEIFVLDRERRVRYRGRVDDQYGFDSGVGYQRPQPTHNDLAEAIDRLLEGKSPDRPIVETVGCLIGRVRTPRSDSAVTYSNQIARIIQRRCVECHREGQIAPFPLETYDDVLGWGEMILEVVTEERMPPWGADPRHGRFMNDPRLSNEEKRLISQWVEAGCPEGERTDLPPPRRFAEGWMISQPDQVIYMSDEPFAVPADGVVEYQYFEADPGWDEDVWIRQAEALPGNRAVVHHIIVFIKPPGTGSSVIQLAGRGGDGLLAGFAPGMAPMQGHAGMARRVPAGSKLVFQMHYTPTGVAQKDRSLMGVVFANPDRVTHEAKSGFAINPLIVIPAGASDHEVTARRRFRHDTLLLSMMPHAHLRCVSFRYEALYPDGRRETLLEVPRYDFNWQLVYMLEEPLRLPARTVLFCTARYDNSEDNPANPDPSARVAWGEQTSDEMMIGWFVAARADGRASD